MTDNHVKKDGLYYIVQEFTPTRVLYCELNGSVLKPQVPINLGQQNGTLLQQLVMAPFAPFIKWCLAVNFCEIHDFQGRFYLNFAIFQGFSSDHWAFSGSRFLLTHKVFATQFSGN